MSSATSTAASAAVDTKLPATYQVVVLAKKANGLPGAENFAMKSLPMIQPSDLKDGEVLVRVLYLSVDPYMRGRIGSDAKKSSSKPLDVGAVIVGATVGQVVHSKVANVPVGAIVHAYSGWREYYQLPAAAIEICNTSYTHNLSKYVGVLGMTGLTSYYGMTYVGEIKSGETVVVSGAAGAVGSIAGQIAKIKGCRVVGLAGTPEKCRYLIETLKFDAAINYKTEAKNLAAAISAACPAGVDTYFDNTGGEITDAVIPLINKKARVVICGQISTYNNADGQPLLGPRLFHHLLWNSAKIQGFLVQDYEDKDQETYARLGAWIKSGELRSEEDIAGGDGDNGLAAAPLAFCKLFNGTNNGKQVVRVSKFAAPVEAQIKEQNDKAATATAAAKK